MRNNQNLAPRARFELATLRLREIGSHFSILNEYAELPDLLSVLSAKDFSSAWSKPAGGKIPAERGGFNPPVGVLVPTAV